MSEDVTLKIKQMIAERINRSLDEITDDARFIEDLGADSLDITELLMMLEEEFQIETDEDSSQISTVGDAVSYISSRL